MLTVKVDELKRASKGWSTSEQFMLAMALQLFNGRNNNAQAFHQSAGE
ncbi:hypothetical protein [Paenibacillus taichungensis]